MLWSNPDKKENSPVDQTVSVACFKGADNGLLSSFIMHVIWFSIAGPGETVATDNGDPTDLMPFPSLEREAFNGLCLVIVRGKPKQSGRIQLSASGNGLRTGLVVTTTEDADVHPSRSR